MQSAARGVTPGLDDRLARLAELSISVGVNLQRGQELVITAPLEARHLVRHLTTCAYRAGASLVTCLYEDPVAFLARLRHADDASLDYAPRWLPDGIRRALEGGSARLYVVGPYPGLVDDIPIERTARLHRAMAKASSNETALLAGRHVNASTIPCATRSWGRTIYPDNVPDTATARLWDAIFTATRSSLPDPVHALTGHLRTLDARRARLQELKFSGLHFYGGETDFTIGLIDGHVWSGGTASAGNGVIHAPCLVAEELYSATHRHTANGRLVLSRPLALPGGRVDGAYMEFRDGQIARLGARHGKQALERLLAVDDGAARVGQVGLAPAVTPLAAFGPGFLNPLLDRNTGCHISFGYPDSTCLPGETAVHGLNDSSIHIDCVFGEPCINVDGICATGHVEPVMRDGGFVI